MNKKILIYVALFVLLVASVTAIWFSSHRQSEQNDSIESTNEQKEAKAMPDTNKILVVYFSRAGENYNVGVVDTGNTELLAKEIVARTGADEFKIVPLEAYPTDYNEMIELATQERKNQARPDYVGDVDLADYETIFFGYPVWWGDMPMIVYNFVEKHDWTGKTVIPFNTHEGSGNAGTYQTLQAKMTGATLKGDGFNMSGSTARTDEGLRKIDNWLEELGYSQ
ncbi:NAD(P)H-dependent oxidoreductase [bacterium]|nr:NAD(P)H-dependent oxidoreductase [bacterium]